MHKASTVIFADVAAMRARDWKHKAGYTYGLHGTPTTFTLEERIATLEGGRHCLLAPSGLAAIALVDMALLQQGDEVLIPATPTARARTWRATNSPRWGISHRFYDPMDPPALRRADHPGDEAGLAGGAGLGDDGVPRPARRWWLRHARAA